MTRVYEPRSWFRGVGRAGPVFAVAWLLFAVVGGIGGLVQDGLSEPVWFLWLGFAVPLGSLFLRFRLRDVRSVEVDDHTATIVGHWGRREMLAPGGVRDVRRQWLVPYPGATRIRTRQRVWYLAATAGRDEMVAELRRFEGPAAPTTPYR